MYRYRGEQLSGRTVGPCDAADDVSLAMLLAPRLTGPQLRLRDDVGPPAQFNHSAESDSLSFTNGTAYNESDSIFPPETDEYIFDRPDVKAIFITLYTIVFCCCFFARCKRAKKIYSHLSKNLPLRLRSCVRSEYVNNERLGSRTNVSLDPGSYSEIDDTWHGL
ncbi:Trissin receptor [Eumeta japonica]|uniref:Trissin receptor n=1 Tax=Eumeta variegata TaxID=151549 RepID=A0A4C1UCS4_EUMVA|nr:Trissin receptor [Eumeta japonica]